MIAVLQSSAFCLRVSRLSDTKHSYSQRHQNDIRQTHDSASNDNAYQFHYTTKKIIDPSLLSSLLYLD